NHFKAWKLDDNHPSYFECLNSVVELSVQTFQAMPHELAEMEYQRVFPSAPFFSCHCGMTPNAQKQGGLHRRQPAHEVYQTANRQHQASCHKHWEPAVDREAESTHQGADSCG